MKTPAIPLLKFLRVLQHFAVIAFAALGIASAWHSELWLFAACAALVVAALCVTLIGLALFFRR